MVIEYESTPMKSVKYDSLLLAISLLIVSCTEEKPPFSQSPLDEMEITVMANENRPISFTNKEAAYYYTQSHENNHPEHAYFEGLTIAQQKIFNGYELFFERQKLNNRTAFVEVFPHKMVRQFENGIRETFWMFDHINAIEIGLDNYSGIVSECKIQYRRSIKKLDGS